MIFIRLLYDCEIELYVPYRITTGASVWIVIWGSSQELYVFTYFRWKIGKLDAVQQNGTTKFETEICMWRKGVLLRVSEVASFEDGKSNTLRMRLSGRVFHINYRSTKGRPCRS